jgi:hypothetical protein
MKLFAAGLAVSTLLVFFSVAQAVTAPVVPFERPITVSTFATTTSTTTTTLPVPASAKCGGFWNLARSIGWEEEHLEKLDYVMWRESRCLPKAFNALDPNEGSAGLTQINYFWAQKTRYYPRGYLQTYAVLKNRNELFEPRTNLLAALTIFRYSEEVNGCGWKPWLVSCS